MQDTQSATHAKADPSLVAALEQLMEQKKLSANKVSKMVSVTPGALSAWRSMSYKGDNAAIDRKVAAFLERDRESSMMPVQDRRFRVTAETSVQQRIWGAIRQVHLMGEIGLVTADSGTGKTRVAEEYVERNPGSILIKCHPNFPARAVLFEIAKQAGIEARGSVHDVLMSIWEKLDGSGKVIIMNEAEHLKAAVLDVVRSINDECGVGILYTGIPRLASLLQSMRGDYTYIWNRVSVKLEVRRSKKVCLDDYTALLEQNGFDGGFSVLLYEYCGGDIRLAESLFLTAARTSAAIGESIDAAVIEHVARDKGLKPRGGAV